MRIMILGSGLMGPAAALYLLADAGVAQVVPLRVLNALLGPKVRLQRGERDITLFRVEAAGASGGRPCRYRLEAVIHSDPARGLTAMARATAFAAAITALLIGRGELRKAGLLTPERGICGPLFDRLFAQLAAAGIRFELTTEKTEPL